MIILKRMINGRIDIRGDFHYIVEMITYERLLDLLDYNPTTGVFIWRVTRRGSARAGTRAGHITSDGYRQISVDGIRYQAHQLAWFYQTKVWAVNIVDHRNRIPDDNRFENLREATNSQNSQNRKPHKNNKTGYTGVHLHQQSGKYRALIGVNGKQIHLGLFGTPEQASEAYQIAAYKHFVEFKPNQDLENSQP